MAKKPNKVKLDDSDNVFAGTNKIDIVSGKGGEDELSGGGKNDILKGGDGNDILRGGNGDDKLNGGTGDDDLFGGNGDDTLIAKSGSDTVDGGAGDDLVKLSGNFADATVTETADGYEIVTATGTVFVKNVEALGFADQTVLIKDLPVVGEIKNLTTLTDNIVISAPNSVDTILGVVAAAVGEGTLTAGDVVDGNGLTVLQLAAVSGGAASVATVKDIASVDVVNAGGMQLNAALWSNIGQINVNSGTAGGNVGFQNLVAGVDLLNSVDGTLQVQFADKETQILNINGVASDLSIIDDAIDANVTKSESATVDVFGENSVTLGDVTFAVGDTASLSVSVSSSADVTVGNISGTVGATGDLELYLYSDKNTSVGNVDVTAGVDSDLSLSVTASTGENVTVGNVSMIGALAGVGGGFTYFGVDNGNTKGTTTVGNVTLQAGATGDATFSVTATGTAGESIGNVTIGNVSLTVDHDSEASVDIYFSGSSTAGTETMGNLTVGNIAVDGGPDANVNVYIDMELNGTLAAVDSMGDFTVGDMDIDVGIGGTLDVEISAQNYASGDLGAVKIGALDINLEDGGTGSVSYSISASNGDVGSVTIGNLNVVMGVSSSLSNIYYNIEGENIGAVSVGSITAAIGQNADFDDYTVDVSATAGDVGSVTVGNATVTLAQSASFSYTVSVSATGDIGSVTVGNITSTAASNADSYFYISADAGGDIDSLKVGDITFTSTAVGAYNYAYISSSATGDAGDLSVGTVTLNTFIGADASATINSFGVIDADISIAGLKVTGENVVQGADWEFTVGDAATYSGDIDLGTVTVGVTKVTTPANYDLVNVLANVATTGDITLGGVDYSGFTAAAGTVGVAIDVSGFLGDTMVVGSALDDVITDNDGVNVITGGAGKDTFVFTFQDANNAGITAADADVIKDFKGGGTDFIDFSNTVAITVGEYFEASYASFNDFIAGAKAQMLSSPEDDLIVGQVGSDVWIAIDNNDGDKIDQIVKVENTTLAQINFADFMV